MYACKYCEVRDRILGSEGFHLYEPPLKSEIRSNRIFQAHTHCLVRYYVQKLATVQYPTYEVSHKMHLNIRSRFSIDHFSLLVTLT